MNNQNKTPSANNANQNKPPSTDVPNQKPSPVTSQDQKQQLAQPTPSVASTQKQQKTPVTVAQQHQTTPATVAVQPPQQANRRETEAQPATVAQQSTNPVTNASQHGQQLANPVTNASQHGQQSTNPVTNASQPGQQQQSAEAAAAATADPNQTGNNSNPTDQQQQLTGDPREYFRQLGEWGSFQGYVYALSVWPQILAGMVLLQNVFILDTPEQRCKIKQCDQDNAVYQQPWLDGPIPVGDRCHSHNATFWTIVSNATSGLDQCVGTISDGLIPCSDGYVYNYDTFHKTAASEWNLVCDDAWKAKLSQVIFFTGMLFSAIISGYCSDRYGRRSIFFWAPAVALIGSIISATASNLIVYTIGSFMLSFSAYAMVLISFVLGVEFVGKKWRLICGNGYPVAFALGECALSLLFYLTQNWRHVELIIIFLSAMMLFYPILIPESIRWQVAHDRNDEALVSLVKAAKTNNIIFTERAPVNTHRIETPRQPLPPVKMSQMFTNKLLLRWVMNLSFGWLATAFAYYGLTQTAGKIAGSLNFYLTFALLALVEIPSIFVLTFAMRYLGRRTLFAGSLISCGLCCLVLLVNSHKITVLVFGVLAKGFVSAAFSLIYIYTAEIFPTVIRTFGLGFCSFWARFGTMASPLAGMFTIWGPTGPVLICGIVALVAGLLALDLPETKGHELPETLEDVSKYKKPKSPQASTKRTPAVPFPGSISV